MNSELIISAAHQRADTDQGNVHVHRHPLVLFTYGNQIYSFTALHIVQGKYSTHTITTPNVLKFQA